MGIRLIGQVMYGLSASVGPRSEVGDDLLSFGGVLVLTDRTRGPQGLQLLEALRG